MMAEQPKGLRKRHAEVVLVDGQRLHVQHLEHTDTASQLRLVFLHEALGSVAMWKDIPEQIALASGCNALIYDRLGHGASDPLPSTLSGADYLEKEARDILPVLLEACKVEQAVLIGHSDGGSIALLAAAQLQNQIKGVVAEAAHVFVEEKTLQSIRQVTESAEVEELKIKVARYHQQDLEPIFCRWPRTWLSESFADWNIEACLEQIHCPLLVIQGEDDEFGTTRQVEAIVAGASGHTESILIENCRHVPHFQAREEFVGRVLRFLEQRVSVAI